MADKQRKNRSKLTTVRVAEYTEAGIAAVGFTLLSNNFIVDKLLSQVGADRITVGLSVEGGYSATANLAGLPSNPVFQYSYYDDTCGRLKITVIQLFILRTNSAPAPVTDLFSGSFTDSIGANANETVLWTNPVVGPGVTYDAGTITFNTTVTANFTLTGTIANPDLTNNAFLNIKYVSQGMSGSIPVVALNTSSLAPPTFSFQIPAGTTLLAYITTGAVAIGQTSLQFKITEHLLG